MLNSNLSIISNQVYNHKTNPNKALVSSVIKQQIPTNAANVAFKSIYICPTSLKKYKTVAEKYSFQRLESFFDGINLDRQKAILNVLVSSCKKENMLGEGKTHVAFSIPGTDDFVIRVIKTEDIRMGTLKKEAVPFINYNLGQVVGSLTNSGANVQFMRKVKGNSIGTPYVLLKAAKKVDPEKVEKLIGQDEYVENVLKISKVPQLTYNHLAAKIKMLKNKGYVYDIANPNNVLLQKSENGAFPSFHIIDDLYKIEDIKNEQFERAWNGSLEDMIYPLMDLNAGTLYCNKSKNLINNIELSDKVKKANAEIFKKCIIASKKAQLPLNTEKFDPSLLSKITGIKESTITKIFDNWEKH